jgi:hypothetical protein
MPRAWPGWNQATNHAVSSQLVEIVYAEPAEKELKLRLLISSSCFLFWH